ncbi:hypothetical protein Kompost2_00039 [Pseudomonas phage vB_PpuP-Kompost-2]
MAFSLGTTTITCTTAEGGFTDTCVITVTQEVAAKTTWNSVTQVAMWEGDSLTANEDGRSFAANLQLASGSKMRFSGHIGLAGTDGTGGHKLQDVLADIPRQLSENPLLTDIFIHCGTNNYMDTTAPAALVLANQIIDAYNAGGVKVNWLGILPRVVLTDGGVNQKYRNDFNYGLANITGKNFKYLNADAAYDPTDITQSMDGTHCTSKGSRAIQAYIAANYFNWSASSWDSFMPVNRILNPTLSATIPGTVTAPATGTIAEKWTLTNASGATVVGSMTTFNGNPAIQVDITGSATSQGLVQLSCHNSAIKALANQILEAGAVLSMTSVAGGSPVGLQAWALADIKTGGGRLFHDQTLIAYGPLPAFSGPCRIIGKTLGTDAVACKFGVTLSFTTGAVDMRLILSLPIVGIPAQDP